MKSLLITLAVSLLLVTCQGQSKYEESVLTSKQQALISQKTDAIVQQYLDLDIFSGIILIAQNGDPIYHKAFGLANREQQVANTTTTLFDIGSMNKTFTSIVIKQLIDEGKLAYDSKLTGYIAGFEAPDADQITVEHLLNHESGFGDYHDRNYFELPKTERTLQKIVERAKKMPLFFPPGEEQEYSNTGYVLLGAIIEKVSGKSYFDNVAERIVRPLGLKNTYLQNLELYKDRLAHGYYYTPLGELVKNETLQDEPNPDGGFLSTTEDVMTFYRSYYYDDLLLNEHIKSDDPYFQQLAQLPSGKAPMTAGGFEGFNTAMFQILSDDISIIVFANMDEPVAEHIAMDILNIIRGQAPSTPQLPAVQNVRIAYQKKGKAYVRQNFEALTENFHPADPKDWILNALGYSYVMEKNDLETAIELFQLNTELFPQVANCWDSYGEALLQKGDKAGALAAYKKALAINPDIPSAKEAVQALEE